MDQVDKKNDYKEIFQGVATLCSERPVETEIISLQKQLLKDQPQEIRKTCVRHSRAGRRRYKRQLYRKGKERYMQASTCLAEGDERTSKPGRTVRP